MLIRGMCEPIHQNLLEYQTEQMKSTADSMALALVASLVEAPVAEAAEAGNR